MTVRTARTDRQRDDAKRADERKRDDLLRHEAAGERDQRDAAERRAREDYEARQVLVTVEAQEHPGTGHNFNRRVTLSTPRAYPIKQVEGCLAIPSDSGPGIFEFGHAGDESYVDGQRVYYAFWAEVPYRAPGAAPIMRFVDWHGNRYYQYRHYTERFGQNTDWADAARKLDEWIRTGPSRLSTFNASGSEQPRQPQLQPGPGAAHPVPSSLSVSARLIWSARSVASSPTTG